MTTKLRSTCKSGYRLALKILILYCIGNPLVYADALYAQSALSLAETIEPPANDVLVNDEKSAITVSGKVTTLIDGTSLPGVNVLVKGTSNGTITDVDGNYTINVPNENDTLVFSS